MVDLPDEVMNRAVDAARSAYTDGVTRYTTIMGGREDNTEWVESLKWRDAIREVAPVLVEAERERIKAELVELIYEDGGAWNDALDAALSVIDEGKEV